MGTGRKLFVLDHAKRVMYLKKLELQGFKSFAGKISFVFQKKTGQKPGITAIVGPNGSGKSCLADAVRWVLGEQSMKMLRGKKSTDIIFSGSAQKARLSFTEVSIFLDNKDNPELIDYPEVAITRRLYRNGDSEYLINKKKARLQDILILLAKANFGQRTYGIIGQGMVDHFILATPPERKEMLDEAAGIKQYQIKKEQTLNKLSATQENLREAMMLLEEITPRLRSLTRQVKKLERREEIERELIDLQRQYYGQRWHEINEKIEAEYSKLKSLEGRTKKKEREKKESELYLGQTQEEKKGYEIIIDLQKEYQALAEQKNKIQEKLALLKSKQPASATVQSIPLEEIILSLEELKKLQDELIQSLAADNLEGIREIAAKQKDKIAALLSKLTKTPTKNNSQEIANLVRAIAEIDQSIKEVQVNIVKAGEEEKEKNKAYFDLQKEIQNKQKEIDIINSQTNEVKIELARLETKREELENEMNHEMAQEQQEIIKRGECSEKSNEDLWPQLQKLKRQLELIGGIDPETEKEYQETKQRHEFLTSQSTDLEEAIKALEQVISDLDQTIKKQFDDTFQKIEQEFTKYFKILFGGGAGKLILIKERPAVKETSAEESLDNEGEKQEAEIPQTKQSGELIVTGIDIHATPPGKKIKNINMLSGGERSLTSIALICAIISSNPSPFIFLDEVDAALDENNSIKFGRILDELSDKTQFIVITHNRATMEKAGILYGITMGGDGASRVLSLKLEDIPEEALVNN